MARPGVEPEAVRVWVDDEHPIFRRGIVSSLVGEGFGIVGESAGLHGFRPERVDALVFGLNQAALNVVGRRGPGRPRLVAIVATPTGPLLASAIECGVDAVLTRNDVTPKLIVGGVQGALAGTMSLPSGVLHQLLDQAANGNRHSSVGLTEREVAVLRLLADGEDTNRIATTLAYSERTVKNVVHDLLTKMNCRNRAHAVALATRQGVI